VQARLPRPAALRGARSGGSVPLAKHLGPWRGERTDAVGARGSCTTLHGGATLLRLSLVDASDVTRSVARPKRLSERGVVATDRLPSARPNKRAALSMPVALHFTLHILSARVWYVATLTQTPPRVHRPRRRVFLEFCTLEPQLCGCAYDPQVRAYG
jgi:hypothetical protein